MDPTNPTAGATPGGIGPRRGDIFETRVDRLASGGRGIGHAPDGRVAFVDGGLPGDDVRAAYTRIKKDFVEARAVEVVTPSPHRVEPRCRHVGSCGGCRLQELEYAEQARQKAAQVDEAIKHIGRLVDIPVRPVMEAVEPFFYRNKMEFAFGRGQDGDLLLGLHRRGRFDAIVDLEECCLLDPRTGGLLAAVRGWADRHDLAPYEPKGATGTLRYLVVRLGKATGQAMVDLVTTARRAPAAEDLVTAVTSALGAGVSVVHTTHTGRATAYVVESQQVLAGSGTIEERLGDMRFDISPASFFQTNSAMAERLYQVTGEAAGLTGDDRLLDLYCGTGAIGISLAGRVRELVGLEQSDGAVADAEHNAAVNAVGNASFVVAKAEDRLGDVLARRGPFDVAVVDPPRPGLHPKALAALVASGVGRVAYVSCNPATLARDLEGLVAGGFHCVWVRPIDMFPHTPHVEAVASLRRTSG